MNPNFDIKSDFEIFDIEPDLIYLDSASTSLVPKVVVKATADFLSSTTVSSRRGAYGLSTRGSRLVEDIRTSLADFMQSNSHQFSFQKSIPSTVASLAYGYEWKKSGRDKIIIAQSEEHSISVSLLRTARILNLRTEMIPIDQNGNLQIELLPELIDNKTGIVAVGDVTVGTGTQNPIGEVAKIASETDALLLVDTTRSIGFNERLPKSSGADIHIFSGNIGLMGPPGLVIQWIREDIGETYFPGIIGGSAVTNVEPSRFEIATQPDKFESGTINLPAIVGLGAALDYIETIRSLGSKKHLKALSKHMTKSLTKIEALTLYGEPDYNRTIFGFNVGSDNGINCHDVALFLDQLKIAVRSGLLCAHPLIHSFTPEGMIQASIHAYNTVEDIDRLIDALQTISEQLL